MNDETGAPSDLETWDRLLGEQTVLFRKTATRNAELEGRVDELQREVGVWKAALKTADEDKKALQKTVMKLERNLGSLKDDNPLVLCLIDGDGNIFSPELLNMGQAGGREAAKLLTRGLTDHMASIEADVGMYSRGQVWLTVYCNKNGLLETLTANDVCTAEQFEAFVLGFNQATPLFSFVDVGNGKEAADAKIKECLRIFTRFPQTLRVFFGGAHDNGYTSTLNYLQNEGLLDKIIILRGYKDVLAYELKSLNLPFLEIEGVFMTKKLPPNVQKRSSPPVNGHLGVSLQDFEKFRSKPSTPIASYQTLSPKKGQKQLAKDIPLHKQKPPPCNFYYIQNDCSHGQNCHYSHSYVLAPEQLNELAEGAKKWPCPFKNRGQHCPYGDMCCMGHTCPKGPKCSFAKQGKCKFTAKHMHDKPSQSLAPSYQDHRSVSPLSIGQPHPMFRSPPLSPSAEPFDFNNVQLSRQAPFSFPTLGSSNSLLSRLDIPPSEASE